jgi:hypothetical protein
MTRGQQFVIIETAHDSALAWMTAVEVARVEVAEVSDDFSMCIVIAGDPESIHEGMSVRTVDSP